MNITDNTVEDETKDISVLGFEVFCITWAGLKKMVAYGVGCVWKFAKKNFTYSKTRQVGFFDLILLFVFQSYSKHYIQLFFNKKK